MVSPQFVAETLVALERLGAQPTLNIFDGTISLAGRLPPLAAGAPRPTLEAYRAETLAGAAGVAAVGLAAAGGSDGSSAGATPRLPGFALQQAEREGKSRGGGGGGGGWRSWLGLGRKRSSTEGGATPEK